MIVVPAMLLLATTTPPQPPVAAPSQTPPTTAMQQAVQPPESMYPVQTVASPYDYPRGAKGRGVVGMNVLIDEQGHAVDCQITQSGGSARLDAATCGLIKRRARFSPARDRNGNPALGRVEVQLDWAKVFTNVRVVRMR